VVLENSWRNAPLDAFIVGLKELPENDTSPLKHKHIFFGHCYKHQEGWKDLLFRFKEGGGELLDLEFLNDERGK
jgi:saccharopine dehydrogenase (NAD+, L-lysine-forming)